MDIETTAPYAPTRDESRALFGQTMGLVAVTAAFFALGAYLGRDLGTGWIIGAFLGALACLFAMNFAIRRSEQLAIGLLFLFGVLMGVAMAQTLVYYADTNPQAPWHAGGATALCILAFA